MSSREAENESVMRASTTRESNASIQQKVPSKMPSNTRRRVLADFNMQDDTDEGEVVVKPGKNGENGKASGPVQQCKPKKAVLPNSSSLHEETSRSDKGSKSEVKQRPPTSSSSVVLSVHVPKYKSRPAANRELNGQSGRTKKRSSIPLGDSGSGTDRDSKTSSDTSIAGSITGREVQTIYETCSQMFNTNGINAQNAFKLRLLDYINVMINSPNYDKSNMQLTSSTLEIGTKIFVCQVDNTRSQVLSLGSEIMLQKRHKKKEGQEQGNIGGEQPQGDCGDADFDDDEVAGRCQKQNKKTIKKRGKFVEEDNSKLLTGLEEQNVKFVTRRNVLNKKFNAMILEDLDFDYLSFFLENEEENPLRTAKDEENMKSALSISKSDMNLDMGGLPYFPFRQLPKFDQETYDIWGQPLNEADGMREAEIRQDPLVPVDADFAYNPEDRPAEYPEEPEPTYLNDTFGNGLLNENIGNDNNGIVPVSFKHIPDLDCLDEYFQRVKGLIKESRSKFGWCGPNFVKAKKTWTVIQRPKQTKFRKEPEPIDFCKIDWNEQHIKFNERIAEAARTRKEDKTIVTLRAEKIIIPYLGFEYEYDFDPVDFENENDAKYVPPIFRLFTNRNQSLLDLITKKAQENASSNYEDDGIVNDNMLPKSSSNHSIEVHINMDEDFFSRLENEHDDQFPQRDYNALNECIGSIKFCRKPKPIEMGLLKKGILSSLTRDLGLDELGQPLEEIETRVSLEQLMLHVLKLIDDKTETMLSISIFVAALLHVLIENRLFVFYDDSDLECPKVICRGKKFNHAQFIPMPREDA